MARTSVTEQNQALVVTGWAYVSLHSADPGANGASELSGGTYARVAVAWGAPSGGVVANTGALSINLPASTTASYYGIWSASSAGTYYIGGALSPAVTTGTSAGVVTIAIGALTATAA